MATIPLTKSKYLKFKRLISWIKYRLISNKSVFVTETHRPIHCSKYTSKNKDLTNDVAIMMQGPIIHENNFTIETINLYISNFPNSKIILSTWEEEKVDPEIYINKNVCVIRSEIYKGRKGYGSTNYQIKGNKIGINKIKELKIPFTLKTRTDQRLGNPDMLSYLKKMLELFPLDNKYNLNQKSRLIGMSFDTFIYRLYGLSDMFLFGETEDVFSYFDCKYDTRNFNNYKLKQNTQRIYSKENICEVYFMTEFLKKKGEEIEWKLEKSLEVFKKRFLIIDSYSLDFFWPKYSFLEDRWRYFKYKVNQEEMTFSKWLRIYNSTFEINEKILDLRLDD